uniref:Uncharacterized protein n=1 Tax=Acrobeloides nanus TaxID=290746 RepID=A0A914CPC6_9BILA
MGGSFRAHASERQQHQASDYRKLSSPKEREASAFTVQRAERLHPSPYRYSHATVSRSASGGSQRSGTGAGSGGGSQKRMSPRRRLFDGEDESDIRSLPMRYYASRRSIRSARAAEGAVEYESIIEILKDFCARTSSHGIPFIGTHSFFGRYIWTFLTLVALLIFLAQTYLTLSDYFEYRTIIEMQLRFEPG